MMYPPKKNLYENTKKKVKTRIRNIFNQNVSEAGTAILRYNAFQNKFNNLGNLENFKDSQKGFNLNFNYNLNPDISNVSVNQQNNGILQTLPANFDSNSNSNPNSNARKQASNLNININESIQMNDKNKKFLNSFPVKYSDLAINNLMNFQERMSVDINQRMKNNLNSIPNQCNCKSKMCLSLQNRNNLESQRSLSNNEIEKLVNRLSHEQIQRNTTNALSPIPNFQSNSDINFNSKNFKIPGNIYEKLFMDFSSYQNQNQNQNRKMNNMTVSPSMINKFYQSEQENLRSKEQRLEIMRIEKNRNEIEGMKMKSLSPPISPAKFREFLSKENKFISDKWKYIAEKNAIKEAEAIHEMKNYFHPKINKLSGHLIAFKSSPPRKSAIKKNIILTNYNTENSENSGNSENSENSEFKDKDKDKDKDKEDFKAPGFNKGLKFFDSDCHSSSSKIRIRSKLEMNKANENNINITTDKQNQNFNLNLNQNSKAKKYHQNINKLKKITEPNPNSNSNSNSKAAKYNHNSSNFNFRNFHKPKNSNFDSNFNCKSNLNSNFHLKEKKELNSTCQLLDNKWGNTEKMKTKSKKKMESFILDNMKRIENRKQENNYNHLSKIPSPARHNLSSSIKYYNLGFPTQKQKKSLNIFSPRINIGFEGKNEILNVLQQHYSPFGGNK